MRKVNAADIEIVESNRQQLLRWLKGENVHARSDRRGETYTCCPDFSCCMPNLAQPLEVRARYARANPVEREGMLMHFLGVMLQAATAQRVYITNGERRILTRGKS